MPSNDFPFRPDDAYDLDQASDDGSRYGVYLRQRQDMYEDTVDIHDNLDPVRYAAVVWRIATGPIMSPGYVRCHNDRIIGSELHRSYEDGSLIASFTMTVPRPAELRSMWRFSDWKHDSVFGYNEPAEGTLAHGPALVTSAHLLVSIDAAQLYIPTDEPGTVSVGEAKQAVRTLACVLNAQLAPILEALGDG
jgi:hypothetical protein